MGSEQPIPPLGLTLGNGEGGNAAEPDVVDPSPGLGDGGEQSVPAFRPHRPFGAGRIYRDQLRAALWTRRGWQMERRCDASIGQPRKALYQLFIRIKKIVTGGLNIVALRRWIKLKARRGQAPIPQGAWRSTICEDPPPKNKKQPQRQSRKPRREASARNSPSQESHPIPSLPMLFCSRRDGFRSSPV